MPDQPPSSPLEVPTEPTHHPDDSAPSPGRLVVLRGSQAGKDFKLVVGINVLGREEGHLIRDVRVSRRHAQIQVFGDEYMLFDLKSTNGTFVNGQRISQPVLLQHGDTLRLGDTILVLKLEGQGAQDPSVIGARTPDLTKQKPGGTTIMAYRRPLSSSNSSDEPQFDPEKKTDLIDHPGQVTPDPDPQDP